MENVVTRVEINDQIIQVKLLNVEKNSLFVSDIFQKISSHGVNIDMISQVMLEDEMRIDFTCDKQSQSQLNHALEEVKKGHPRIMIYQNCHVGKLMVEGEGMKEAVGVASSIFEIFAKKQIPMYQVTTSDISISYVTDKEFLTDIQQEIIKIYQL